MECIQDFDNFHNKLLKQPLVWEDGYLIPSSRPGIGVELDEEVAAAHPYTGTALHLDARMTPVYGHHGNGCDD